MNAIEGDTEMLTPQDFQQSEQSPRTRNRILKLQEEDHTENLYQSCCSKTPSDKRLVVLLTQVSVSILVLGFSGSMLAVSEEPNDRAIYMSLISSTLSYWLGKDHTSKD